MCLLIYKLRKNNIYKIETEESMSEKVNKLFSEVAEHYDLMNNLITFGMHSGWKKKLVELTNVSKDNSAIDIATGTGDVAILLQEKVGSNGRIVALDFNKEMLDKLKEKDTEQKYGLEIELGDALSLKYDDNTFDASTISYGIRNVDDPLICLKEMSRVVKPNGKVVILETGQPIGILSPLIKIYQKGIIPILGKIIANQFKNYYYLPDTASRFPSGDNFTKLMEKSESFSKITKIKLMFGVSYIYIGIVK